MSRRMMSEIEQWKTEWLQRAGQERTLRVRWLLNPDSEPLRNVQIIEQHRTVIDIRSLPDSDNQNVLPVILIPPLVNAHTHLEFSALTQPLQPAQPFQDWIRAVMQWRQTVSGELFESIRSGLQESCDTGVRLIGEIATQESEALSGCPTRGLTLSGKTEVPTLTTCLQRVRPLFGQPLSGPGGMTVISFQEAIGLRPERIHDQLHRAEQYLAANPQPDVIQGLSPHAPYTVHPDLLQGLMALAVKYQSPVAMHLAETTDEIELLTDGRGRFGEFLASLGLFDPRTFSGGRSVLEVLRELARAPKVLAIHGNYFNNQDIAYLAQHPNITTVYCPRTHSFFGHTAHPFRKLLAAGARVILGTDSRASNPDLSIWRELQHVARSALNLSAGQLLAMITTQAADAMGIDAAAFRICQGGTFNPVLLSFDDSLSHIDDIVRHQSTTPVPMFPT